jgi:hypothetical protein
MALGAVIRIGPQSGEVDDFLWNEKGAASAGEVKDKTEGEERWQTKELQQQNFVR